MTLPAPGTSCVGDQLARIREYYVCFNERRFQDAAALFAEDAVLEQLPFQRRQTGGAAYLEFVAAWTQAFPDAVVSVDSIVERAPSVFEVDLLGTGTHHGDLAIGGCVFRPTGARVALQLRELLEMRGQRIAMSCLSFDFQELVHELVRIDETQLLASVARLHDLDQQLRAMAPDAPQRRDLLERIGNELDSTRHIVRPYFTR